MIGKCQPLDLIVQIVAQTAGDPFSRLRCQPAHAKREQPLQQRQNDDPGRHPRYLPLKVGVRQYIVHEVAQQVEHCRAAERGQSCSENSKDIDLTKAGCHTPQTDKAIVS